MGIITVSHKSKGDVVTVAKRVASLLNLTYVDRKNLSTKELCRTYGVPFYMQWGANGPMLWDQNEHCHAFHLSMAHLRIIALDRGGTDHLVQAIGMVPASVLDCTLGLAADSVVMSYAFGTDTHIVGIEGLSELAYITNYGLRHFKHKNNRVNEAMKRVQVCSMSYEMFLKEANSSSYDIVYFDPLFTRPVKESPQFVTLRDHMVSGGLQRAMFEEACRVAKYKVIVKERIGSPVFKQLGISHIVGGKYSRVAYGVYNIR